MNFKKFGLGKDGLFGVCDGLSNFTGVPVLAFRILALVLMYKGLFVFYWYAWILLFVGNISSGKKSRSVVNIRLGSSTSKSTSNKKDVKEVHVEADNWDDFDKKFEKAWNSKSKSKKKKDKKKDNKNKKSTSTSNKKMSFADFKSTQFGK